MDLDLLKLVAEAGGPLALSMLVVWLNRQDTKQDKEALRLQLDRERQQAELHLERERQRTEQQRADKQLMIDALHNNTMVLTELTVLLKRRNGTK